MNLQNWIRLRGGIVHRNAALEAGFSARSVRAQTDGVSVRRIRRYWLATVDAPPQLETAAQASGRLACVSLARHRAWWMPEDVDPRTHVTIAASGAVPANRSLVLHWNRAIVPHRPRALTESIEDALDHIARCLPREQARVLWDSAVKKEHLSPLALRRVHWTTRAAVELAEGVNGLSDSGLESIFLHRLGPWGLPIRQQIVLAGRPVDVLIGERLVVQVDGFEFHSTAADRGRDVAHDRELQLRGYTVLRFTYAQILHDWPTVERAIARAIAAGQHRAA